MAFCSNCGQKLTEGAKFCNNCGTAVGVVQPKKETVVTPSPIQTPPTEEIRKPQNDEPITKRQTVYDGEIHKCPHCGEVIEAFMAKCPTCGFELNSKKVSSTLQKFIDEREPEVMPATRSMDDDFMCIVNTYLPRYKSNPNRVSAENNIDCPLGELGLVNIASKKKKTYRKSVPAVGQINPWVMLAIIIDCADGKQEISLNDLLNKECSIGKIFNLDAISLLDILHEIERLDEIKVIRTAGLDVVCIKQKRSFLECVERYYSELQ